MPFAALFLGLLLQPAGAGLACGDPDAQTASLRSPAGFVVVLKLHSEDDHMKDTHLCFAEYSLETTIPGETTARTGSGMGNVMNSDGDWSRPITFHIDGFSADGNLAYIFLLEGGKDEAIDAIEYDLRSGQSRDVSINQSLLRTIPLACADTLHIFGISRSGQMVIATSPEKGCLKTKFWELAYRQKKTKNGGILPQIPLRLPSDAGVTPLDPGTPVVR